MDRLRRCQPDHSELCAASVATFKTRDVSGISLGMYSAFTLGIALWLAYGLLIEAWPVVIANVITLVLAASILAMRLRFGRKASALD